MPTLLPATNVLLPTDVFSFKRFKEYKDEVTADCMIPFEIDILHQPTGLVVSVEYTGRSDEYSYGVCVPNRKNDVPRDVFAQVLKEWESFAKDCLPIFREKAHKNPIADFQGLWDGDNHRQEELNDAAINLFLDERDTQSTFSRKRNGLVIRRADANGELKEYFYKTTDPVVLKNSKVEGSYWNKATKNWVAI